MSEAKNKWLHIRLTTEEDKKLRLGLSSAIDKKMSVYIRSILFGKPVTVYTRNKSIDDILSELVVLRRELNAIGNNLNQAVKKIHFIGEISDAEKWMSESEQIFNSLAQKITEIKINISSIADKWSQE